MVYSSAYRRAYREPSWDDYSKQEYIKKMQYRSTRRSIEHRHQPWHWESDSGEDDIEEIVDDGEKRGRAEDVKKRMPTKAWEDKKEIKENGHSPHKSLVLPQRLTYEEEHEVEKPKHSHASRDQQPKEHEQKRSTRKHHRPEGKTKQRPHSTSPEKNKTFSTGKRKQIPFLPYGWANDGPVDIWKTHNVLASKPEVGEERY